jgi:hypothetical protein
METSQQTNSPNFDTIWAALQELAERQKETDRILSEKSMELNKRIGALTNLFGEVTEHMLAPDLCDKFRDFGFDFPRANPNVIINDKTNNISLEIDIMLENGDKAMLVEAKTKLTYDRVTKHVERLEKMRRYADIRGDKRIFLGAVAGIVVTEEVRNFTLDQGFYLIEPAGDNFTITPPNGTPKQW